MLFINKRIFLCTLFRLIFIDLQNVGVISAAPCILGFCSDLLGNEAEWKSRNYSRCKTFKPFVLITVFFCCGVNSTAYRKCEQLFSSLTYFTPKTLSQFCTTVAPNIRSSSHQLTVIFIGFWLEPSRSTVSLHKTRLRPFQGMCIQRFMGSLHADGESKAFERLWEYFVGYVMEIIQLLMFVDFKVLFLRQSVS